MLGKGQCKICDKKFMTWNFPYRSGVDNFGYSPIQRAVTVLFYRTNSWNILFNIWIVKELFHICSNLSVILGCYTIGHTRHRTKTKTSKKQKQKQTKKNTKQKTKKISNTKYTLHHWNQSSLASHIIQLWPSEEVNIQNCHPH
jgi:amino acid permease